MAALTTISARQAAYITRKTLSVAKFYDIYGGMGAGPVPRKDSVPLHNSKVAQFRRYENIPERDSYIITEGVTPDASIAEATDLTGTLLQMGDYVIATDISADTVEENILSIYGERNGNRSVQVVTEYREGILIAGTNVLYANGSARADVNTKISRAMCNKVVRALGAQKAQKLTKMLASVAGYNTTPIPASYVGVCSSYTKYDMEETIGESGGFVPVEKYSNPSARFPLEFGKLGQIRWVEHADMTFFADSGAVIGATGCKSTTGVNLDVYAALVFGEESYGVTMFGGYSGKDGVESIVKPLGSGGTDDPLNQRATVGWKTMQLCKRLNENWMYRIEHAVTA